LSLTDPGLTCGIGSLTKKNGHVDDGTYPKDGKSENIKVGAVACPCPGWCEGQAIAQKPTPLGGKDKPLPKNHTS